MMDKTVDEYLAAQGWSSNLFLQHAIAGLNLPWTKVKIGRTVIYVWVGKIQFKFYVHHNGRNKEWMTLTDKKGKELYVAHHSTTVDLFIRTVRQVTKV